MERRRFINKAILTITLTGVISGVFWFSGKVFSLSYQQDIGVSFTFNPTLKVTVTSDGACSPADLCIHNLSPGTVSDSNIITVSVLNNTGNGYNLNATVGNDTTFNTRDLIHTDSIGSSSSSSSSKFSSVDYGSSLSSNTDLNDNTWGYSYSLDDGTTWTNYSGLPLYSDTTNIATLKTSLEPNSNIEGDEIKFKIAAKASSTINSGEYQNIINFYATVQPIPVTLSMAYENAGKTKYNGYYKLQDMNSDICNATEVLDEGSQMQAIDIRDNKVYWITKLQDGHCWMTQNLDLNLSTSTTLTHDDTDLGWGSDTATTSWAPVRSTIDATGNSISGWTNDNNTPYSVDPGDYYWKNLPFYPSTNCYPSNNYQYCSYITKSAGWSTYFATTPYESNGTHGHVGNKYNWSAAIANNNTSGITANTYNNIAANPQNSICPAGWRLPTISGQTPAYTTNDSPNEFARIAALYDNYAGNTSISSEGLEKAPLYMPRSGHVYTGVLYYAGRYEYYWSSTVSSSTYARSLVFHSTVVSPENEYRRYNGFSVRCLAR